jgi:hypothetical protein
LLLWHLLTEEWFLLLWHLLPDEWFLLLWHLLPEEWFLLLWHLLTEEWFLLLCLINFSLLWLLLSKWINIQFICYILHVYVVCSSSIYGFWLPLWYLQTLPSIVIFVFVFSERFGHVVKPLVVPAPSIVWFTWEEVDMTMTNGRGEEQQDGATMMFFHISLDQNKC